MGGYPRFLWRVKMGEVERRRGYAYNRVLIESERILAPEFNDAIVFLSGAQIEMLRNVSQYLNRLGTYAAEYNPGYYLVPTDEDFDDILEIVADLEETLMGNPNVIWGYNERWVEHVEHTKVGAGGYDLKSATVPNGYVYTLQSVVARNLTNSGGTIPKLWSGAIHVPIGVYVETAATVYRIVAGLNNTLKYGDEAWVRFYGVSDGDELEMFLWGYKMVVPEE